MKNLTINQAIDKITTYLDSTKPSKNHDFLRKELSRIRALKMEHPKGGLLPYPKGFYIETYLMAQSSGSFDYVNNINRASLFAENKIKELAL